MLVDCPDVTGVPQAVRRWLTSPQPAVIFDFNGTLSDDEPILFDIFEAMFAEHLDWRMSTQDYRDELLGHSDREIIEIAVARHGRGNHDVEELLRLRGEHYLRRVAEHNPITDATVELVELLAGRGVPMAIVTGAQRADVIAVVSTSPAGEHLPILVAAEDVSRGKPDPEGFLSAAAQLRRDPGDILVFEDSVPGVRAALAAGMHCIAVAADPTPELRAVAPVIVGGLSPAIVAGAFS